jgi:AcrR family transcriptional regulator
MLSSEGISAVRVERLARSLDVTKGSFYWHFRNHGELLSRLRQYWADVRTIKVDLSESRTATEAEAMLLWVLRRIILEDAKRYDPAMRAWALFDPATAVTVRHVDEARLGYVKELFLQIGFDQKEAELRSRMSYYYVIGENAAGIDRTPEDRLAFLDVWHRWLTSPPQIREA